MSDISRNILTIKPESKISNGISYMVSNDGITVDGYADDESTFHIYEGQNTFLKVGTEYLFSGCPRGGSTNYWITIFDSARKKVIACDRGEGDTFRVTESVAAIDIYIRVAKGCNMNQIQFRPAVYVSSAKELFSLSRRADSVNESIEDLTKRLSDIERSLHIITDATEKLQSVLSKYDSMETLSSHIEKISTTIEQSALNTKDSNIRVRDIQDRIYDIKGQIGDIQIRTHDVQDQTYNIKASASDVQIRTQDIQDRTHDQLNLVNAHDAQDKMLFWSILKKPEETILDAKKNFFMSLPKQGGLMEIKQKIVLLIFKEVHRICQKHGIRYWLDFGTMLGAKRHGGFIPWDDDIDLAMMRSDLKTFFEKAKESKLIELTNHYAIHGIFLLNLYRVKVKNMDCPLFLDIFVYDYCNAPQDELWQEHIQARRELVLNAQKYKNPSEYSNEFSNSLDEVEREIITDQTKISEIEEMIIATRERLKKSIGLSEDENEGIIWGVDNFSIPKWDKKRMYKASEIFPLKEISFEDLISYAPQNEDKILADRYGDIYVLPNDILEHEHFKDEQLVKSLEKVYEQMLLLDE